MAVEKGRRRIPADATCVAIFPDRGERYFETIYLDVWVTEHFGEVLETRPSHEEAQACLTMTY